MQPPTGVVTPAQAGKLGAVYLGGDPMGLEEEGRELALEASALGDGGSAQQRPPREVMLEVGSWAFDVGSNLGNNSPVLPNSTNPPRSHLLAPWLWRQC